MKNRVTEQFTGKQKLNLRTVTESSQYNNR